jgi:opacity protein-like surface antigen
VGIGISVGYYSPDVEADGGDGAAELFVRYTAYNGLSVSAGAEVAIPSIDNASAATLTLFVDPRFVVGGASASPAPVISARFGWSQLEREGGGSNTSFVLGLAAGLQVRVVSHFGLEFGGRYTNFTDDISRIGLYGGMEVTF